MPTVDGSTVLAVTAPGPAGEADALFTAEPGLPLVVATADCAPIVLEGPDVVAVVHAGWRGAVAGVVPAALEAIAEAGHVIERAAIGPTIGACCYEVGPEVADRLGHNTYSRPRVVGGKLFIGTSGGSRFKGPGFTLDDRGMLLRGRS